MSTAQELKARVQGHLDRLKGERDRMAQAQATDLAKIDAQILASQRLLAAWDSRVDGVISFLDAAGLTI